MPSSVKPPPGGYSVADHGYWTLYVQQSNNLRVGKKITKPLKQTFVCELEGEGCFRRLILKR